MMDKSVSAANANACWNSYNLVLGAIMMLVQTDGKQTEDDVAHEIRTRISPT